MINRIKNIFNSAVCEFSMLIIACSLIIHAMSFRVNNLWTDIATISILIGGAALFSILIWATYMLISQKTAREMNPKPRFIIESCNTLLFICWLFIIEAPVFALIMSSFFIWNWIWSMKQTFS